MLRFPGVGYQDQQSFKNTLSQSRLQISILPTLIKIFSTHNQLQEKREFRIKNASCLKWLWHLLSNKVTQVRMESLVVRKCVHYVAGAAAAVSAALLGSMSFLKERGLGGVVWPLAVKVCCCSHTDAVGGKIDEVIMARSPISYKSLSHAIDSVVTQTKQAVSGTFTYSDLS